MSSHCEWLPTVSSTPDVINFTLLPVTSLLKDVPGKGFLFHAINLYLRCTSPFLTKDLTSMRHNHKGRPCKILRKILLSETFAALFSKKNHFFATSRTNKLDIIIIIVVVVIAKMTSKQ